jgi:malate synthase
MTARTTCNSLQVATPLYRFIEDKVLPGTGIKSTDFWKGFDEIVKDLSPKNEALLAKRDRLQRDLDQWHKANPGPIKDMKAYRQYLQKIGYIEDVPANIMASTQNVDDELALQAGPQLVVPILNARYALNAANARWGSLYDALYGTDVISEADGATKGGAYNPVRGAKVVAYARQFLDESVPLAGALYGDVVAYSVVDQKLSVKLKDGSSTGLIDEKQFVGYQGDASAPSSVLLRNHGIHIDIQIDRTKTIGAADPAGVNDVVLEAALSTILDLEDSVAVVDADDKVLAYENWLGILKGT